MRLTPLVFTRIGELRKMKWVGMSCIGKPVTSYLTAKRKADRQRQDTNGIEQGVVA